MKPKRLIIVRKTANAHNRTYHVKGKVRSKSPGQEIIFLKAIRTSHRGIDSVRFPDACSVNVTLYQGFVDDWPKIEKRIFRIISGRRGWTFKKVVIRRKDVNGNAETNRRERFRSNTSQAWRREFDEFVMSVHEKGGNVASEA